jgi:hypothetical protein
MRAVAVAIIAIVKNSTFWRPMRSPSGPSTRPPSGRTMNEIAKPRSVTRSPHGSGRSAVNTAARVTVR